MVGIIIGRNRSLRLYGAAIIGVMVMGCGKDATIEDGKNPPLNPTCEGELTQDCEGACGGSATLDNCGVGDMEISCEPS